MPRMINHAGWFSIYKDVEENRDRYPELTLSEISSRWAGIGGGIITEQSVRKRLAELNVGYKGKRKNKEKENALASPIFVQLFARIVGQIGLPINQEETDAFCNALELKPEELRDLFRDEFYQEAKNE